MVKTFTWEVERGVDPTINYKVIEAQFGDGYKQTTADGINNKEEQYAIRTHAKTAVASEIMAFFDEHAGCKSFLWKPPLGQLSLFTCVDPKPVYQGGDLYVITATFVKSYASIS